jgi:PDZ domain/Activator of Hsp90 ATPase homolog 1-like protein
MEHRERADGFEATFVVTVPRAQAWKRLLDAEPVPGAFGAPEAGQIWIPAIEGAAEAIESIPEERLRATKTTEPCAGTEIVITLEDDASGTRITVVQSGFGGGFAAQRAWLAAGWAAIVADFAAFFERGVALGRHVTMWWSIGCDVTETDAGLVVGDVSRDGFAARAGLERDDLILQLAGTPVLDVRDLAVLVRGPLHTGVETTACVLRGDQVFTMAGTI